MELVAYHQKLVKQIQEDILPAAEKRVKPSKSKMPSRMLATSVSTAYPHKRYQRQNVSL